MQLLRCSPWPCPRWRCALVSKRDQHRTPHSKTKLTIVPSIVINQSRPIGHTSNLVSVIPPTHDHSVFGRVLSEPVVCFAEIVDDVLTAIRVLRRKNDRRRRVCVRGHPRAMQDEEDQHAKGIQEDSSTSIQTVDSMRLAFLTWRGELRDDVPNWRGRRWGCLLCLFGICRGRWVSSSLLSRDSRFNRIDVGVEERREGDCSCNTDDRRQRQHEAHHDPGKVTRDDGIDDDENVFITKLAETHDDTCRKQEHKKM